MALTRVYWERLKNAFADGDGVLLLFNNRYRHLLLQTIERLDWQATYRTDDYDFADWETVQNLTEEGHAALLGGIMLADLIGYIDEVEGLLKDISLRTGCCPPEGTVTYQPVEDVPLTEWESDGTTYPATYAGVTMTSAAMYHLYLCGAANKLIDNLVFQVSSLSAQLTAGLLTAAGLIGAYLGVVTFGLAWLVEAGAIALWYDTLKAIWENGLFDAPETDIETNRDLLICAALQNNPTAFAAAVETVVGPVPWSAFFQFLNYNDMISALFSGEVDGAYIDVEPTTVPCDCLPPADFDFEWTFDVDAESWALIRTTWTSAHDNSMLQVPVSAQYGYLSFTDDEFLALSGLTSGVEIEITMLQMDCYLLDVVAGGAPNFLLEAYTLPVKTEIVDNYNNWTKGVLLENVEAVASEPATKVITTNGGSFLMVHLQHKGEPTPNSYITRVRLRGNIV